MWSAASSRGIVGRWVVECELVLQTPAHLGNGDASDRSDLPLLADPLDGSPLLSGHSLAGALRSYLREREAGFGASEDGTRETQKLFGGERTNAQGEQSALIVDDARGSRFAVDLRHGNRLDGRSRTTVDGALYDIEVWEPGTTFALRFELALCQAGGPDTHDALKTALASALQGLADGGIAIGARKTRGYGRVLAQGWKCKYFDLTSVPGLLDWIENGGEELSGEVACADVAQALGVGLLPDAREYFSLDATLQIDGSLLMRSGGGRDDLGPDMDSQRARRPDYVPDVPGEPSHLNRAPVATGTGIAGALRSRATAIAHLLSDDEEKANALIGDVFGPDLSDRRATPRASRLRVEEHFLKRPAQPVELVQTRVSIDRFTGGALEAHLFNELPVWSDDGSVSLRLALRLSNPRPHEAGLLLQLLKDLWTGDLPLGGEVSVGRGRLRGAHAALRHHRPENVNRDSEPATLEAIINQTAGRLEIEGDRAWLEGFARELSDYFPEDTA
jgi:CRISPR/Cas system CMR subunit Cmr4 (Cas7 group RAMP superfamily)